MTCQKAIGVAKAMKKKFGEALGLTIYTNDSNEAESYNLKASTTVFVTSSFGYLRNSETTNLPVMMRMTQRCGSRGMK